MGNNNTLFNKKYVHHILRKKYIRHGYMQPSANTDK